MINAAPGFTVIWFCCPGAGVRRQLRIVRVAGGLTLIMPDNWRSQSAQTVSEKSDGPDDGSGVTGTSTNGGTSAERSAFGAAAGAASAAFPSTVYGAPFEPV